MAKAITTFLSDLLDVALGPFVDDRYQRRCAEESDDDVEEADPSQTLRDAVGFLEDVGVAVEEGEEDDVDYCEVERQKDDDRLSYGQEDGAVQGTSESNVECLLADLDRCSVSVVSGDGAQVLCFPFEQGLWICFRLEKDDSTKYKARDDESDPLGPSP